MSRITIKQLEQCCEHLNRVTKSPLESHTRELVKGFPVYKSAPGHFCLSQAYGGMKLVRYTSTGGSEEDITYGYDTKPVLYGKIQGVIAGLQLAGEK